jgi:hypothetical protein
MEHNGVLGMKLKAPQAQQENKDISAELSHTYKNRRKITKKSPENAWAFG